MLKLFLASIGKCQFRWFRFRDLILSIASQIWRVVLSLGEAMPRRDFIAQDMWLRAACSAPS